VFTFHYVFRISSIFGGRVSCMRVVSGALGTGFRANPGDRDRFDKIDLDRLFRSKIRAGQGAGGQPGHNHTHTTPYKLVLSPRVVREGKLCVSQLRAFSGVSEPPDLVRSTGVFLPARLATRSQQNACERIRMYAGPVSWVSNYKHLL